MNGSAGQASLGRTIVCPPHSSHHMYSTPPCSTKHLYTPYCTTMHQTAWCDTKPKVSRQHYTNSQSLPDLSPILPSLSENTSYSTSNSLQHSLVSASTNTKGLIPRSDPGPIL